MLANQAGGGGHGHGGHHRHDERLEQQGEAATFARPWHAHALHATGLTGDARHTGVQVSLVLKEVEMPPAHFRGVIGRAVRRTAARACETRAFGKRNVDIETPRGWVEPARRNQPRRNQTQRQLQKIGVPHRFPLRSVCHQHAAVLAAVKNKPCGWPPKKRPFLTAAPRACPIEVQAGTKRWPSAEQSNAGKRGATQCRITLPMPRSEEADLTSDPQSFAAANGFRIGAGRGRCSPPNHYSYTYCPAICSREE